MEYGAFRIIEAPVKYGWARSQREGEHRRAEVAGAGSGRGERPAGRAQLLVNLAILGRPCAVGQVLTLGADR